MKEKMGNLREYRHRLSEIIPDDVSILAVLAACVAVMIIGRIPCPILYFTGISCAGCGMSRAWLSLLRLDLRSAFHYHPLFWMPPVFGLLLLFRRKLSVRVYRYIGLSLIFVYLGVYIVRMLSGEDPVVVFRPENGFFFRLFSGIFALGRS